jgi:hypothetical protein
MLQPAGTARAQGDSVGGWPREIDTARAKVVIYQPQPEQLQGNRLDARAAVAIEPKDKSEPVFGAVWFQARLDTDREERTATIADISVTQVRFPDQDEKKAEKLRTLLEQEIPRWHLPISMDRLLATLELVEERAEAAEKINTKPPKILFVSEPAILISIDGEPRLKPEEGTDLMRVINTAFTLLFVPSQKTYYLYADVDTWYTASDIKGKWALTNKVPSQIATRAPQQETQEADEADPEDGGKPGPPPAVIVETEPAELISSKGEPEYTPISGTDLLYMSNTDSDVLLDITSQRHFVLLAGRWFASSSLQGPWKHVPGGELPADFARIPEEGEMGTVLYAVPGTDVAKEAVLDAQIPQTATVERKKATLSVEYDGDPKFEPISGTDMSYAVNTATPVILVSAKYYACDEAVWFVANRATGPWVVATSVPEQIYAIPADCPIYNVTFVRVYGSTPEVVYVGYTPGYTHTYVYHTTVVYGTGYYWPGWYGRYYYARPATWGFHVRYNPWRGWSFGFSYSAGPFRFTIGGGGWYRGGWWGPGRYRGYRHGYRHGARAGYRAGYRSGKRSSAHRNVYRSQRNQARSRASTMPAGGRARAGTPSNRANNVYADRNGNVHRRTDQGWQTRGKQGWQSQQRQRPTGQQGQRPTGSQARRPSSNQQLDRSHQARQRGNQRSRSHGQSRQRSGGGRRSGGGGRRR